MSLAIGDQVVATVVSVATFGLFCEYESNKILVLVSEVGVDPDIYFADKYPPGTEVEVVILRYNSRDHLWLGSVEQIVGGKKGVI